MDNQIDLIEDDATDLRQALASIGDARLAIQSIVERDSFPQMKRVIRPDIGLRDSAAQLSVFLREAEGIRSRAGEKVGP